MTRMVRQVHVSRLGIAAVVAALLLAGAWLRPAAAIAQDATPEATPTGGVPCTALFGIAAGNACVLVVHASPDAGAVDVYVDGQLVLAGAAFAGLGDFVPVAAGVHQLQATPTGLGVEAALIDVEVEFEDGVAYEVAVVGLVAEIEVQVYPVDTAALPEGDARVRAVHASPDAPAVDLALTGGEVLIDDVAFPDASDYVEVPAASYDLELRPTGTEDVALTLPGTILNANFVYSIYAIGQVATGTLSVFVVPVLVSPEIAGVASPEATPAA